MAFFRVALLVGMVTLVAAVAEGAGLCSMQEHSPWVLPGNRGLSGNLYFCEHTGDTASTAFNCTMDIRHGPGVVPGKVLSNGSVVIQMEPAPAPPCIGNFSPDCKSINWTTNCLSKVWCEAWTVGCTSPPPPYGEGFSFSSVFSSNAVLQREPAMAAVYGIYAGDATKITVTVSGDDGSSYTVAASFNTTHQPLGPEFVGYDGPVYNKTWKAFLKPTKAGGNYTIFAQCVGCTESGQYENATLYNVTFGDVYHCSGQSNMWLPLLNTFSRNATLESIITGKQYRNIRIMAGGSANGVTNPWLDAYTAATTAPPPNRGDPHPLPMLFQFGATCWYFAQRLTDEMVKHNNVVPLGLSNTAIGGQRIEEYSRNSTEFLLKCSDRVGETSPKWNGQLYAKMTLPFVDMTIKGWIWYQGENNMGGVKGNSLANVGYSCEMVQLVRSWRAVWSEVKGTTDPLAPWGTVTLASSGSEGGPNMGAMRQAQTGGFGTLPSPEIPNSFLSQAYDLDDEWGPNTGLCIQSSCCNYNDGVAGHGVFNATACNLGTHNNPKICANACAAAADTQVRMGGIHPRTKRQVGDRLGIPAYRLIYGGDEDIETALPLSGPTLAGCRVNGSELRLFFNTTILGGDKVVIQPYNATGNLSFLDVQTDPGAFCMEPMLINQSNSSQGKFCPTWAGGNGSKTPTTGLDEGWIRLPTMTLVNGSTVAIDLGSLAGTPPSAVRYGWGITNCCDLSDPTLYVEHGCVAACPLVGASGLAANPFLAKIVNGKCSCVAPQVCDQ